MHNNLIFNKMKKNKKVVYLTEWDVIFGNNCYLKSVFCVDKSDKENGGLSSFWYDCDHVKTEGETGRGFYQFVKHENKNTIYIVTLSDYDIDFYDVIEWWLQGCEDEIEINNNWDEWDKVKKGVAYRGGSGYFYSLYAKELIN